MKDSANKYYILKLWIFSMISSSIIFIIASILKTGNIDPDIYGLGIFMFFYMLTYSFPSFVIVFFFSKFGLKCINQKNKIIISSLSILLTLFTIYVVFGKESYDLNKNFSALTFSIISPISIILTTIFLKTKKINE